MVNSVIPNKWYQSKISVQANMGKDGDDGKPKMISLNGSNWQLWKPKMIDYLIRKQLQKPIKLRGLKPKKVSDKVWHELEEIEASTIKPWMNDSIYHLVANEPSSWVVWRMLADLYEMDTTRNKMYVIRQFVNLKYRPGTAIALHLNKLINIIN